jgi:hypothetical protein
MQLQAAAHSKQYAAVLASAQTHMLSSRPTKYSPPSSCLLPKDQHHYLYLHLAVPSHCLVNLLPSGLLLAVLHVGDY